MSPPNSLRYPIGHYHPPVKISPDDRNAWIIVLEDFPRRLETLIQSMSEAQLDTPYRPGGWTVRQLVHHIADSHMNSYIRFKWAMTEDNPRIKTYDQETWGEAADAVQAPVALSLDLLRALHARWVYYLRSFLAEDYERTLFHPEMAKEIRLDWMLGMYAWHCDHHYAHIARLIERGVS